MDLQFSQSLKEHRLIWAVSLSLVLHFLFLTVYIGWGRDFVFDLPAADRSKNRPPIAFEIVESPSGTDRKPDQADFLSDRNARASDKQSGQFDQNNLPFSEGRTQIKNFSPAVSDAVQSSPSETQRKSRNERYSESPTEVSVSGQPNTTRSAFSRDQLIASSAGASGAANRPKYRQTQSSAEDLGGLSLNTYAWEYAPYLLDLKHRIEKNIFPPPIYTRMGIGGSNIIRFRILPNGQLVGPDLIDSRGEKSLIATSENAVKYSAPFKPLPEDFPEPYLEVTARFDYQILTNP